ncbi:TonB-dependent receptor [Arenibacter troitsensis]|uniref:Outer membrane receptor for ferrienterochelin and colicins n=1 Tax=Arenibacter troitsensis TaxID=188872 RepID=A0A1X7JQQ4_9FLAO|nr:Outer membrane receptor for ferrienterochelin and colicins [Arenibacter troitsensis]
MKNFFVSIFLWIPLLAISQNNIEGMVMEDNPENKQLGLAGANVYWLNSQTGTITKADGSFVIPFKKEYNQLVISYVGFESDTLFIDSPKKVNHWLKPSNALDEVVIQKKRDAVQKSYFSPQNVVTINSAELLKAACCNLSESFETNPAIDVNFSDALTGTKQIQMLGLTSPYLLITQENIPMVRGASQAYGLTFTPGTWVESIQITKGAGSVVNGYESISGQINTELVKPSTDKALFVNGYANLNGRLELNTHLNEKLTDKWSTGLYLHANRRDTKEDNNGDGFLDAPLGNQINVLNRWQYQNPSTGWVSFINLRFLNDDKQLGQTNFVPSTDKFTTNSWGSEINTRRFDTSLKLGYVFPELPFQSLGFQTAYNIHKQDSYFGFNEYNIDHESIYSNLLFNSIIGDTKSKFKTGLTFAYDGYGELVNTQDFSRVDKSIGAFFEYSYDNLKELSFTAGIRVDNHNNLGTFVTPRLHARYMPWERGSFRASLGRGKRAANIFAENQQLFASSRQIRVLGDNSSIYGLDPEDAWNYGASYIQGFSLFGRTGDVTLDYYVTNFKNQVVVDWENPMEVSFYNLEGKSLAKSFQFEINYNVLKNVELRTAYKYYDVETDYLSGTLQKPLQAQHRFFANLGYTSLPKENGALWRMDYTLHSLGKQRLPNTSSSPEEYQFGDYSTPYSLMNAQLTRVFNDNFEIYVGGENLTSFTQENAVVAADHPFGTNFDTTMIYAPVMGRMFYAGFRYKL